MKISDLLESNSNIIDNKKGWGAVPNNQEVDYLGLRVKMSPKIFIDLAAPLDREPSEDIIKHIQNGGTIGSPFLIIEIPESWEDGDLSVPARVVGHEGRNRMLAIAKTIGNAPIEVHLFFSQGLRNRHITDDFKKVLNKGLVKEKSKSIIKGPLFSLTESMLEWGRIVKGVNTTVDVGPDEIKTQTAKFGNSVDRDGRPPTMNKKTKGSSTNVLYNLGMVKESEEPRYTAKEWAIIEGGHTLEETTLGPKKPGKLFTALNNEAFDTDVEWIKGAAPEGASVYAAKVDDAYIEITYKPTEKGVYISFTRGARMSVTGEGGQNKIFGAVINHIKQWVAKNKPEQIVFSAFKPRTGAFGSQDTTRSGLYRKMVQRFASQNGYDYDVEDTGNEDTFILTRRQSESLEEDIAWQNSVSKHIFDFKSNEFSPARKNFLLPISSSILKNIKANPARATVFHVTGYDNLDAMIKNQGTKKAISTFSDMDTGTFASGVQGGGGLVFEVDANVLISDSRDLDSKVDNSGRRWIKMKYIARNTRNFNTSDLYEDVPQLLSNLLKKYTNKSYNPYMEEAVYDAWKELGTTLNSTGDGKTLNLLIKDFMDGIYKIYQTHKEDLIKMLRHHLTQRTIGSDLSSWDEIVVNEYKIKKIHVLDSVTLRKNPQVMDRVKSTGIKYDVWNNSSQLGSYIRKIADKEKAELGESFSESKLTYSTPNFEHEWEEAERYPEFRKIGKAAWIELAGKGKAVTIRSAKGINNTDAAEPDSFASLDKTKQKRALAQLKKGTVEMPIVAVYSDGWKELVGGNTRLTAMLAQNKKAKVWVFKVPDEVAELAEMTSAGSVAAVVMPLGSKKKKKKSTLIKR